MKADRNKNMVVHLPHPGVEHIISFNAENFNEKMDKRKYQNIIKKNQDENKDTVFPWNRGKHRRKFICNKGNCVDSIDGGHIEKNVDLYFWGEWEQPSKVSIICNENKDADKNEYPSFVHTPFLGKLDDNIEDMYERYNSRKNPNIGNHNTDPYVFGSQFYYSCCSQEGEMKELKSGDIIIFYGADTQNGKNVKLDTVFVVGGKCLKYGKNENGVYFDDLRGNCYYNNDIKENIPVTEAYLNGVLNAIWFGKDKTESDNFEYILYFGATYEKKVNGMFSYYICKTQNEGGETGFPRVSYKVEDVNDNEFGFSYSVQKQKYNVEGKSILDYTGFEDTKAYWSKLTNDILSKNYKLGVYAEEPTEELAGEPDKTI